MNTYPSWIHRVPEMIEALALADAERIDRRLVEMLFDLRRSAAKELLRRMGAELCGHSLVISRGLLMARLREAYEHPDYRWEVGVSSQGHIIQPVRDRPRPKDSGLVAWEAPFG